MVQVKNGSTIPVTEIRAVFQYVDAGGTKRQRNQEFSGIIAPGRIASVRTGLALYAGTSCMVQVTAAQLAE